MVRVNKVFKRILGDPQIKTVKRLQRRVKDINALSDKYKKLSDKKLREQTEVLKKRLEKESLDKIMPSPWCVKQQLEPWASDISMCSLLAVWHYTKVVWPK